MKTELLHINNNRGILVDKGNNIVVVLLSGFEGKATTEKKFKLLADNIHFSSFRFDYSGVGLSDGDFFNTTVQSMRQELKHVLEKLKRIGFKKFIVVAHSLSACVVVNMRFSKKIFLAPALNQKELLRYWFVKASCKKRMINLKIDWRNYQKYFQKRDFLEYWKQKDKMTKENYISSAYFLENNQKDYAQAIGNTRNILHVHGDADEQVPLGSLNKKFIHSIIVYKGDHDLERPDMVKQWLEKTIQFIETGA